MSLTNGEQSIYIYLPLLGSVIVISADIVESSTALELVLDNVAEKRSVPSKLLSSTISMDSHTSGPLVESKTNL